MSGLTLSEECQEANKSSTHYGHGTYPLLHLRGAKRVAYVAFHFKTGRISITLGDLREKHEGQGDTIDLREGDFDAFTELENLINPFLSVMAGYSVFFLGEILDMYPEIKRDGNNKDRYRIEVNENLIIFLEPDFQKPDSYSQYQVTFCYRQHNISDDSGWKQATFNKEDYNYFSQKVMPYLKQGVLAWKNVRKTSLELFRVIPLSLA